MAGNPTGQDLPSMDDHADALHPVPRRDVPPVTIPGEPGILMPNGRKQIPSRPGRGGD